MSDKSVTNTTTRGPAQVRSWKFQYGKRFLPEEIATIVADEDLDLTYVVQLVKSGCPPELAVRIARPL